MSIINKIRQDIFSWIEPNKGLKSNLDYIKIGNYYFIIKLYKSYAPKIIPQNDIYIPDEFPYMYYGRLIKIKNNNFTFTDIKTIIPEEYYYEAFNIFDKIEFIEGTQTFTINMNIQSIDQELYEINYFDEKDGEYIIYNENEDTLQKKILINKIIDKYLL
jgi:hypothetical protein